MACHICVKIVTFLNTAFQHVDGSGHMSFHQRVSIRADHACPRGAELAGTTKLINALLPSQCSGGRTDTTGGVQRAVLPPLFCRSMLSSSRNSAVSHLRSGHCIPDSAAAAVERRVMVGYPAPLLGGGAARIIASKHRNDIRNVRKSFTRARGESDATHTVPSNAWSMVDG